MKIKIIFYFLFLFSFSLSKYTVHIISHSHTDPGWIKTFEKYYEDQVEKILSNVVKNLMENEKRTFVFSEISFFKKWWDNQNDTTKMNVKKLVKEKRFEFINGGYVMEDEAVGYYSDGIIQLRTGLEFLKKNFDVVPNIVWLLDEFGHTMAHAYVYSLFGFKKIILGRSTQDFKNKYHATKDLNLNWVPFDKKNNSLFTHIVYDYYCPPSSIRTFCDDALLNLNENSLNSRANGFFNDVAKEMAGFRHNQYILFFGCDFTFVADSNNFLNIEKLMEYINNDETLNKKIELKYSTLNEYFNEVEKDLKSTDDLKNIVDFNEDFLPYIDWTKMVWTGFYTSRPYIKGKIRESSIFLQLNSILNAEFMLLQNQNEDFFNKSWNSLHAVSISQHHDAITGTAKTFVNDDYIKMLELGDKEIEENSREIFKNMFNLKDEVKICISNNKVKLGCSFDFDVDVKEKKIGIFNPSLQGKFLITIEVGFENKNVEFDLVDNFYNEIEYDLICVPNFKCYVNFIYDIFSTYGIVTLFMKNIKKNDKKNNEIYFDKIQNEIDLNNNFLFVENFKYNIEKNVFNIVFNNKNQKKFSYEFSLFHGFFNGFNDGAYVFNTNEQYPIKFEIDKKNSFYKLGKISNNILLRIENSILLINFYKNPFFIQTISILDNIKNFINSSKNFVILLESNINNENEFYTDNSGLKMVKRILKENSPVNENFFPINKAISIKSKNDKKRISIFNDRPEGGTSLKNGSLILMLNRWSSSDDNKGLNERLNEPQSSNNDFEIKHIFEFDYDDEKNKEIYFLADNYFQNGLLMFYELNYNNTEENQTEINNFFYKISKISEMFVFSEFVKMQILYVNEGKIILQFINEFDEYFNYDEYNLFNKKIHSLSITNNSKYDIKKCDVNGFNCQQIYFITNKYINYFIEPLDLLVFSIELNKYI